MNKVVVVSLSKKCQVYEKVIKKIAKRVLQFFKKENCYLEIFLINSRKMRILNKKFKNKNKTTGILTFIEPKNFPHPESKLKHLGEIYLNADQCGLNADQRGKSQRESASSQRRSAYLLVHGLLHLFGYNHQKKGDRIKMEATEQKLLRNFHTNKHKSMTNFHKSRIKIGLVSNPNS